MAKTTLLSKLAFYATLFALCVIALGAFTRLIDAGLGCPDWPGCYGHLTVPATGHTMLYPDTPLVVHKAWAEMLHRYVVFGLSLLMLLIVALVFKKQNRQRHNLLLAFSLILLLVYQISLGRWTVTLKLLPTIVTQHLLGGFLIAAILWLIYLFNSSQRTAKPLPGGLFYAATLALILLVAQILLGAWTSTNYASLSCADFPFCNNAEPLMTMQFKQAFNMFSPVGVNYEGGVLPTAIRQTIQMTHRLGALIVTLYFFIFAGVAAIKLKHEPEILGSLYLMLALLVIQLSLGIANVMFKLPLFTAICHNLIAAILLLAVITLIFKLRTAAS